MIVGQGPAALAVGAGGGCLEVSFPHLSLLSTSLWETVQYRLKYCLKGLLNPKQPTTPPFNEYLVQEELVILALASTVSMFLVKVYISWATSATLFDSMLYFN